MGSCQTCLLTSSSAQANEETTTTTTTNKASGVVLSSTSPTVVTHQISRASSVSFSRVSTTSAVNNSDQHQNKVKLVAEALGEGSVSRCNLLHEGLPNQADDNETLLDVMQQFNLTTEYVQRLLYVFKAKAQSTMVNKSELIHLVFGDKSVTPLTDVTECYEALGDRLLAIQGIALDNGEGKRLGFSQFASVVSAFCTMDESELPLFVFKAFERGYGFLTPDMLRCISQFLYSINDIPEHMLAAAICFDHEVLNDGSVLFGASKVIPFSRRQMRKSNSDPIIFSNMAIKNEREGSAVHSEESRNSNTSSQEPPRRRAYSKPPALPAQHSVFQRDNSSRSSFHIPTSHSKQGQATPAKSKPMLGLRFHDFSRLVKFYPHLMWSICQLQARVRRETLGVDTWTGLGAGKNASARTSRLTTPQVSEILHYEGSSSNIGGNGLVFEEKQPKPQQKSPLLLAAADEMISNVSVQSSPAESPAAFAVHFALPPPHSGAKKAVIVPPKPLPRLVFHAQQANSASETAGPDLANMSSQSSPIDSPYSFAVNFALPHRGASRKHFVPHQSSRVGEREDRTNNTVELHNIRQLSLQYQLEQNANVSSSMRLAPSQEEMKFVPLSAGHRRRTRTSSESPFQIEHSVAYNDSPLVSSVYLDNTNDNATSNSVSELEHQLPRCCTGANNHNAATTAGTGTGTGTGTASTATATAAPAPVFMAIETVLDDAKYQSPTAATDSQLSPPSTAASSTQTAAALVKEDLALDGTTLSGKATPENAAVPDVKTMLRYRGPSNMAQRKKGKFLNLRVDTGVSSTARIVEKMSGNKAQSEINGNHHHQQLMLTNTGSMQMRTIAGSHLSGTDIATCPRTTADKTAQRPEPRSTSLNVMPPAAGGAGLNNNDIIHYYYSDNANSISQDITDNNNDNNNDQINDRNITLIVSTDDNNNNHPNPHFVSCANNSVEPVAAAGHRSIASKSIVHSHSSNFDIYSNDINPFLGTNITNDGVGCCVVPSQSTQSTVQASLSSELSTSVPADRVNSEESHSRSQSFDRSFSEGDTPSITMTKTDVTETNTDFTTEDTEGTLTPSAISDREDLAYPRGESVGEHTRKDSFLSSELRECPEEVVSSDDSSSSGFDTPNVVDHHQFAPIARGKKFREIKSSDNLYNDYLMQKKVITKLTALRTQRIDSQTSDYSQTEDNKSVVSQLSKCITQEQLISALEKYGKRRWEKEREWKRGRERDRRERREKDKDKRSLQSSDS